MNDIAILLATYQGARYVEQMLESLEGQTCKEFVCGQCQFVKVCSFQ